MVGVTRYMGAGATDETTAGTLAIEFEGAGVGAAGGCAEMTGVDIVSAETAITRAGSVAAATLMLAGRARGTDGV